MAKPLVAIVGRPNVGKSTFFNKLTGERKAIVENMPGVTRDRLYADTEWCGYKFTVIDTGGLELKSEDVMWSHIRNQAMSAIDTADVIVFMLDGKQGLLPDDEDVAAILRGSGKPVIVVVNKIDNIKDDNHYDFYSLGFSDVYAMSAEHSLGIGDVLDNIVSYFVKDEYIEENSLKIAIVGKPNAGKSSLVNKIVGYERVIVSDIAGTTRDAIDTPFNYNGKSYTLIDTAGIRRKRSIDEDVEHYSVIRALGAIRRADVAFIVMDTSTEISEQDVRLCGYVHEQGKPSLIIMNKWDLIEKDTHTIYKYEQNLKEALKFMDYFKSVYVSALTGKRIEKLITEAEEVYLSSIKRIPTGVLNDIIHDAVLLNEPPNYKGRKLKIYYVSQTNISPPEIVFFVNDFKLVHFSYRRYLENTLRKAFDFKGTPIRLVFRNKDEQDITSN